MTSKTTLLPLLVAGAVALLGSGPAGAAARGTHPLDVSVGGAYGLVKDNWNTGTSDQGEFQADVAYTPGKTAQLDLGYDFRSYFQTYFHADQSGNYTEENGRELWHDVRLTVGVTPKQGTTLVFQPYAGPHFVMIRPGVPDMDMNIYGLMGGLAVTWAPGADMAEISFTARGEATMGILPSTGSASFVGDALTLFAGEVAANFNLTREVTGSFFLRTDMLGMTNGARVYDRGGIRLGMGF